MKKTIQEPISLLDFLQINFPNSSKNKLRKMLSSGRVVVNSQPIHKAKHKLSSGDIFELFNRDVIKQPIEELNKNLTKHDIEIIYEDDDILVVNKPSKLLSVATDRLENLTLHSKCVDYLKLSNEKSWCYIVHRLDKETSGIMLMSKNKTSKEYLQQQFAQRGVYRIYHAIVEGRPEGEIGTLTQYLLEDKNLNIKSVKQKHKHGKQAITHWEVLDYDESTSLIRVMIETGRRHQIRMAMKELGCPIVGDEIHGAQTNPLGRICLHATSLEFLHPKSDEPIYFESKPPFAKI
tara:strand:- start:33 stop:908 length:876 start_codon:yes stop_codon:yes gene_type:complete